MLPFLVTIHSTRSSFTLALIFGAALDVFSKEPIEKNNSLLENKKVSGFTNKEELIKEFNKKHNPGLYDEEKKQKKNKKQKNHPTKYKIFRQQD